MTTVTYHTATGAAITTRTRLRYIVSNLPTRQVHHGAHGAPQESLGFDLEGSMASGTPRQILEALARFRGYGADFGYRIETHDGRRVERDELATLVGLQEADR